MKRKILRLFKISFIIGIILVVTVLAIDKYIDITGKSRLVKNNEAESADAIIILGAYVFPDGKVSDMLADRLETGLELYKQKKAPKILVSGDHGRKEYDEVNNMRKYLLDKGIPSDDIFMDHAGFDTYNSMYRAKEIFEIKKAIVVSQEFHAIRATYISKELGIEIQGVSADLHVYPGMKYYRFREVGARLKAFTEAAIVKPQPKFLGEHIPISSSGTLTLDQ